MEKDFIYMDVALIGEGKTNWIKIKVKRSIRNEVMAMFFEDGFCIRLDNAQDSVKVQDEIARYSHYKEFVEEYISNNNIMISDKYSNDIVEMYMDKGWYAIFYGSSFNFPRYKCDVFGGSPKQDIKRGLFDDHDKIIFHIEGKYNDWLKNGKMNLIKKNNFKKIETIFVFTKW